MLSARGWWLLAVAGTATLVGVLEPTRFPAGGILGLTVLAWLAVEWVLFQARWRAAAGRVTVERQLLQGGRVVSTAWAGATCTVRTTVTLTTGQRQPLVVLDDRVPEGFRVLAGSPSYVGGLAPGEPVVIEYELKPPGPGVVRFEGVRLRAADLQSIVYRRTFLRQPVEVLVLPPLADDEGHRRADKRFNMLPPPGVHRLRRAGSGSELLDLRDYRPGDPPKTIAWKASARRDRLITKEYESDVPVRCVLFLDAAARVRAGEPGRTPLARLVAVAAAVAQAAAGNRDLVGLTVFDEESADVLPPARTPVHTVRLLAKLAEASGRLPAPAPIDARTMARHAEPLARELYPDLFESDVNTLPLGMYWLPLLDSRWGWLVPVMMMCPLLVFKREVADVLFAVVAAVAPPGRVLLGMIGLALLPLQLGWLFWLFYGARGFFHPFSTRVRKRKQLGAIFAAQDGDGPAAVERYIRDDAAFVLRAGKFLHAHHVRDLAGPAAPDPRPDAVLADALVRAVLRARDNELYVLLADVTDPGPVADAVRLARGRHHHVMVVVPWPDGMPREVADLELVPPAHRLARQYAVRQAVERFDRLRSELVRGGAAVVRVSDADPVRAVLARLDRVRGVRSRR